MRAVRIGPGPKGYGVMSDAEVLLLSGLTQPEAVDVVREADNVDPTKRGRPWVPAIKDTTEREDMATDRDYAYKVNRTIQNELAMRESM